MGSSAWRGGFCAVLTGRASAPAPDSPGTRPDLLFPLAPADAAEDVDVLLPAYARLTQLLRRVLRGHGAAVYLEVHARPDGRADLPGPRRPRLVTFSPESGGGTLAGAACVRDRSGRPPSETRCSEAGGPGWEQRPASLHVLLLPPSVTAARVRKGHGEGQHQGDRQGELPPPAPEPHAQSWGPRTQKGAQEHVCPLGRLRCKGTGKTFRSYSCAGAPFPTRRPAQSRPGDHAAAARAERPRADVFQSPPSRRLYHRGSESDGILATPLCRLCGPTAELPPPPPVAS